MDNEIAGQTLSLLTAVPTVHEAAMAAYGRTLAETPEEKAAFTALLHNNLRELGVMAPATQPGGVVTPPGDTPTPPGEG